MSGFSQFTRAPNLNEFTSDYVPLQAGRRVYPDPTGVFYPMGVLYTTSATVDLDTGTDEQVMATYTLPANAFDQAGRKLRIRAAWNSAANAHSKECKLYFGAATITTGAVTTASARPLLELTVTASSTANRFLVWGWGFGDTTGIVPVRSSTQIIGSWGAAQTIQATGQTGTSGAADLVLNDFSVEFMN